MKRLTFYIISCLALDLLTMCSSNAFGEWTSSQRPPYYESYSLVNPEYHNYDNPGYTYYDEKYKQDRYNTPTYQETTDPIMHTYDERGYQESVATSQEHMQSEAARYNKELGEHQETQEQRYAHEEEERRKEVIEKQGAQAIQEPQETHQSQSSYY